MNRADKAPRKARAALQFQRGPHAEGGSEAVHEAAAHGLAGGGGALPFGDRIQHAFGRHDVSGIVAHTGASATRANDAMGSRGYATGHQVAFRGAPDLHTAAHEAAHVIQQRAGVSLKGGVGQVGDAYERHADAVADRVVQGKSAEDLLDRYASGGGATHPVQHRMYVQHHTHPGRPATATQPAPGAGPGPQQASPQAPQQAPTNTQQGPETATGSLPTTAQRAQAEALRAQARAIRSQLDQQARGGGTPDAGLLAQLRGLRAQQLPIWRAIAAQLRTIVASETQTATNPAATPAPEGAGPSAPPAGPAPGAPSGTATAPAPEARSSSRRARRRRAPEEPRTEAGRALQEANERVSRLERAAARDRLREIEQQLRQGGGGAGRQALTAEREQLAGGMGHFQRMSQGDRRWGREEFRGNRGQTLYNRDRNSGELRAATIQAGGCGALSLAMVMAFYERENPEADIRGETEIVHEAVAAIQRMGARGEGGRITDGTTSGNSASGTNWNTVANGVGGQMANLRGASVSVRQIAETLRSGRQVVWQKIRPAHFVVISSIRGGEGENMQFHVSDPGFRDHDVTIADIAGNHRGSWVLTSRY